VTEKPTVRCAHILTGLALAFDLKGIDATLLHFCVFMTGS
jgi:hypothetical protein